MRLWVAGRIGREPDVVAQSLELAIVRCVRIYRWEGEIGTSGFDEQWTGGFIGGEPSHFRLTTTFTRHGESIELYLLTYDVADGTQTDLEKNVEEQIAEIWDNAVDIANEEDRKQREKA